MELNLKETLLERQAQVLEKWYNRMVNCYPPKMKNFWEHKGGQFTQPMPYSMAQNMKALLRGLLLEDMTQTTTKTASNDENLSSRTALEQIMKICAVQNLAPSEAIRFIVLLKEVLWAELMENPEFKDGQKRTAGLDVGKKGVESTCTEFRRIEQRVDELTLLAFDFYMECRQKINDLRIQELKGYPHAFHP